MLVSILICVLLVVFRATLLRPILTAMVVKEIALKVYSEYHKIPEEQCDFKDVMESQAMDVTIKKVIPMVRPKWTFAFDLTAWSKRSVFEEIKTKESNG